jgi:hypothetical protein
MGLDIGVSARRKLVGTSAAQACVSFSIPSRRLELKGNSCDPDVTSDELR